MPNSFTQIYIHYVFSPKSRFPVLTDDKGDIIIKYMSGICNNYDCNLVCGNVMPDHVHLLVKLSAKHAISEIAKVIKANTSRFLNTRPERTFRFEWQEGYGAFSVSHSLVKTVSDYIGNQVEHHKKNSFGEEFRALLQKHNIQVPS
jgi:putative transposase